MTYQAFKNIMEIWDNHFRQVVYIQKKNDAEFNLIDTIQVGNRWKIVGIKSYPMAKLDAMRACLADYRYFKV